MHGQGEKLGARKTGKRRYWLRQTEESKERSRTTREENKSIQAGGAKRASPNTHIAVSIVPQMTREVLQASVEPFLRMLDVLSIPLRVQRRAHGTIPPNRANKGWGGGGDDREGCRGVKNVEIMNQSDRLAEGPPEETASSVTAREAERKFGNPCGKHGTYIHSPTHPHLERRFKCSVLLVPLSPFLGPGLPPCVPLQRKQIHETCER